jgi:hypothetical protein
MSPANIRLLQQNGGFFFRKDYSVSSLQKYRDRRPIRSFSENSAVSEADTTRIVVDGKRIKDSRLLQLLSQDSEDSSSTFWDSRAPSLSPKALGTHAAIESNQPYSFRPTPLEMTDRRAMNGMSNNSIMSDSDNKHTKDLLQMLRFDNKSMSGDKDEISKFPGGTPHSINGQEGVDILSNLKPLHLHIEQTQAVGEEGGQADFKTELPQRSFEISPQLGMSYISSDNSIPSSSPWYECSFPSDDNVDIVVDNASFGSKSMGDA